MEPELQEAYDCDTKQKTEYFRGICDTLFSSEIPRLPEPSHFSTLRDYILSHPLEFGPNIRHGALIDMRMLVWHCSPESFKVDKEYYLAMYGQHEKVYQ